MAENVEMVLRYGYAWREHLADQILREWRALSFVKRLYWTARGKAPGDREAIIRQLG